MPRTPAQRPAYLEPRAKRSPATRVAAYLSTHEGWVAKGDIERACGVSRSAGPHVLAELVDAGLVERLGDGKHYRWRRPLSTTMPTSSGDRPAFHHYAGHLVGSLAATHALIATATDRELGLLIEQTSQLNTTNCWTLEHAVKDLVLKLAHDERALRGHRPQTAQNARPVASLTARKATSDREEP